MKLVILSRNKNLHSIQRLLKEAKALRVICDVIDPLDCQILVNAEVNTMFVRERLIPKYDVVIPRIGTSITEYGLSVVQQFELMGVKAMNSAIAIAQSRDKLRCLQLLAGRGIDVPTTVLTRDRGTKLAMKLVQGAPLVLKVLQGTQGVGVMLLESEASASSVLDTVWNLDQDVILQQYVSESAGRDIRALVIGDQVVAAMRRQAKPGEFRSNIHQGGEGVLIELKDSYKRVAVQAAKTVGLSLAGVDMLESLSGPKVLEINSSPGFEGIEAATKLNVAKMIIQHAVNMHRGYKRKRLRPTRLTRRIKR